MSVLIKRIILEDAGVLYPSVVTNADRIRAMTDEELAEFCIWMCPPGYDEIGACEVERERCYNCWLDWLKQEATP